MLGHLVESEEDQEEDDDNKIAIEIAQSFGPSSNYFKSYLVRTIFEFVTATILLIYFCYAGFHVFHEDKQEVLYCPVGQHFYQCAGHPKEFYKYVFYISVGNTERLLLHKAPPSDNFTCN